MQKIRAISAIDRNSSSLTVNGAPDCTGLDSGVINYYLPDLGHVPQSLCLIPSYKIQLFKNLPLGKMEGLNKVLALKRT